MNERRTRILSLLLGFSLLTAFGITTDEIMRNVYDSTNTALRTNLVAGGGAAGLTVGTSTITGGTNAQLLYDNSGVLGERANPLALTFGGTAAASFTAARCVRVNAGGTALEAASADCGSGSGTVTGTGTVGLIPDWTTTTALGDSAAYRIAVPNAGATGTTVNKLAKFTSAGAAVITGAAETAGILGIVHGGAGTTGSAIVTVLGADSCVSDNATTAGHYATISSSVAGDCSDTGSATFPAAGTVVIGTWTETGTAASRTMFFGTPDIASASAGGGGGGNKNPAGAAGDVQYRASTNAFAAEGAFNYNATNNQLLLTGGTSATDNTTWMLSEAGTLPVTPTATVEAIHFAITGAGSASQITRAMRLDYLAGYTGSSATTGISVQNASVGTGATINLGSTTAPVGNAGLFGLASAAGAGENFGLVGDATGSTTTAIGIYGRSAGAVAGTNVGVLGNAAASTEGTGPKNIGVLGTITTTSPNSYSSMNGSYAGIFDGGTLPDTTSQALRVITTLPAASGGQGVYFDITSPSSSTTAWSIYGSGLNFNAGYTGTASQTVAAYANNLVAGAGGDYALSTADTSPKGNIGYYGYSASASTGHEVGILGEVRTGTGANTGVYGKATTAAAGTNVGVLGNASSSTEGTNLKNVAGWFTLGTTDPATVASNTSVALVADGAGSDALRTYNSGTLTTTIASTGAFSTSSTITSSNTTNIGWVPVAAANQACNTTCTSACVFGTDAVTGGILACTDATADSCLCAGSS